MGRIVIWAGSKADILKEALGPAFARLDEVPDNVTVPFEEDQLLEAEPGDVVLAMGTKCLKVLQKNKLCHGGRTVSSLRQTPIASPKGGLYLVTLDPFTVRTQADAPSLIRQDVALACRLALTGKVEPELGDSRLVEDLSDLLVEIDRRLTADPECYVELACDTETLGLHPEGQFDFIGTAFDGVPFLEKRKEAPPPRLITIQFTLDEGSSVVLQVPPDGKLDDFNRSCVEWLLTNERILLSGANWKYDSRWIHRHWGILSTNLSKDVLLMASMVDENRSNSLKSLAWDYSKYGGYDQLENSGYDKGRMDLIPIGEIVPYAGCDTSVTAICARKLKTEMQNQSPALVRLYRKVVLPASSAFEAMEHEGVHVDLDEFAKLRTDLTIEIDTQEQAMLDLMPQRLKLKYADKIKDQLANDKSPMVPSLLRDYFFTPYGLNLKPKMVTEKSGEPSTAKAHLMMFHDQPEAMAFIAALEAHGSASKTRSTFVDGFLKHLRADGRLHPSYFLFAGTMFDDSDEDAGTVTGRVSAREPAYQTVPKKTKWAKRIRACYPAPPGYVISAFDFSQGELKVVACVAEETNMIAAFRQGMDLHCVTAAAFMGISYEEFRALEQSDPFLYTLMRTGAKAGNFGLLYGMQVNGFREYARINYGVTMSEQETTERREKFFGMYPGLVGYHEDKKRFARRHGYVESPLGRIRHLPLIHSPDNKSKSDAERQAINAPIQSTLNDLTFFALAEIRPQLPQQRWFGMVHDQILAYTPEDLADTLPRQTKEIMDNLPIRPKLGWDHALQFTSDGEVGARMNELKKITV